MSADLIAWLRKQLDADEQAAHAATPGPWTAYGTRHVGVEQLGFDDGHLICELEQCPDHEDRRATDAWHIATWNPRRVLDELTAKQELLDMHELHIVPDMEIVPPLTSQPTSLAYRLTGTSHRACRACDIWLDGSACRAVRLLARPYADRPGWREEWAS
jgi:hypothetical protein